MELVVGDDITANPTAADIARAIDRRAAKTSGEDWSILLENDDNDFIEAELREGGTFDLVFVENDKRLRASHPIDVERAKTIFVKFLAADATWRDGLVWQTAAKPAPVSKGARGEPPTWAVVAVVASIAVTIAGFQFSNWWGVDWGTWTYVGLIALPMVTLIAAAVAAKVWETRRAATWLKTTGKVVKSTVTARHHESSDGTTVKNEPSVTYEFSVLGLKYRGERISIGEDAGGANTEATVARYPVGAVVTVYYDRKNPNDCVLERDMPQGMGKGCAALIAIAAIMGGLAYYLSTGGFRIVEAHIPKPENAAFVVAITCFGAVALLFFFAFRKISKQASSWPFVQGKVVSSDIESYRETQDGRTTTSYRPAVEYSYSVNGHPYRSRQIKLNITTGGSKASAEKQAAKYPVGGTVEVHYEPANPGNAALENPTGMTWIIFAAALACFAVAAWAAGFFG